MSKHFTDEVQMQFLRPEQLEARASRFPVVYVPFGLIEWHGLHLPLGTDALKAHGILIESAKNYGGVVYPPIWFHSSFEQKHLVPLLTELFQKLKQTGFRVIMGVSGHNVNEQITMIEQALEPVLADGTVKGTGLWEFSLSKGDESGGDHAAKWETSNMLHLHQDTVDLKALGDGEIKLDMSPPHGIGGLDPRRHASAAVGRRNCQLAAKSIGEKARSLLDSLPAGQRNFNIAAFKPPNWWAI